MANLKDFIKQLDSEVNSLEDHNSVLDSIERTVVEVKQRQELPIEENVELTQLTLEHIQQKKQQQESMVQTVDLIVSALKTIEAKLEAKLATLNNTPGKQGIEGPTGKAGKDGKDGQAGRDGINGKDGTDGKDGVDGKDGISVVDAKIDFDGSLVVYLSNGNEIDCGQILSPDVAQNIIINSGGSGTSQTVTDTLVSLQNQINTLTGIDGVLGDMAQQNANAVAITGGTINGTTIGATTPSTVNATTITGQTGVLRGTGNNLLLQSNTFTTTWTNSAVSSTIGQTDPFGGSNAWTVLADGTSASHALIQTITLTSGITYTQSWFLKAGTNNFAQIRFGAGVGGAFANFNLSNGTLGTVGQQTGNPPTSSITSVGNGWYRCTVTVAATATSSAPMGFYIVTSASAVGFEVNTLTTSILAYGAQIEVGSVTNTYIPTTTTAVYGTPTLSFSGVSEIGLLSTGALYLQPAGTGALQAQATTSTTAGGNARGANAVDWQTIRYNAVHVASSSQAVIAGGNSNTASGTRSFVGSGYNNTASGTDSVLGGGFINTTSGVYASVISGYANTASGYYGFVGNGFTNSTTSNSAVTTQSGTMNATTAVTLSGSNANIKVGQYITGTSIASDTYVAAISGTALTLSKVASGSSTSTLSFFTPHGVVVGGGNNQATGSYSFIGGGGDAGTAANRNTASGDYSVVVGGARNAASGIGSFVGGGGFNGSAFAANTASGTISTIAGGIGNTASATGASIQGGFGNTANGAYSSVLGGTQATTRSITGNVVAGGSNAPIASTAGVSQFATLVLGRETTDATPTALASNSSAAGSTNQVILPNNSAYFFRGEVISGVTGGGNTKGWTIEGVIKRGANAASTALVGTPTVTSSFADAGASTWTIAVTADTTNGGLRVTFTGQASTTIRTVCQIRTTEMTY